MAGREHSVPEIAENVITQAETFSIFFALRHIASVTACDSGTSGINDRIVCLLSVPCLKKSLPITPDRTAERSTDR